MRDEAEKKVLAALSGGEWLTAHELLQRDAGEFTVICLTLARLEEGGFAIMRLIPAEHHRDGDHFWVTPPRREYHISGAGMDYWLQWQKGEE